MVRLDVFNTSTSQKIPTEEVLQPLSEAMNLILSEMACYIFSYFWCAVLSYTGPTPPVQERVSARCRWFSAQTREQGGFRFQLCNFLVV